MDLQYITGNDAGIAFKQSLWIGMTAYINGSNTTEIKITLFFVEEVFFEQITLNGGKHDLGESKLSTW